eukprot:Nk52_evm106s352 gene=Nk52_evmTU106s352
MEEALSWMKDKLAFNKGDEESSADQFPPFGVHQLVFLKDSRGLKKLLKANQKHDIYDLDAKDPRGLTALHIAVMKNDIECVKCLLDNDAKVKLKGRGGWDSLDEAISMGNRDMIRLLLEARRSQSKKRTKDRFPSIKADLDKIGDMTLVLHWRFHSWLPFVSRLCPSDTYVVRKKGLKVRVDTTLVDFSGMKWHRGDVSYIFDINSMEGEKITCLDNENKLYDQVDVAKHVANNIERDVDMLMSHYINNLSLPTKAIKFTRAQSGLIWTEDKSETIDGRECRVYEISGATLYMRKRREHLSDEDIKKMKAKQDEAEEAVLEGNEEKLNEIIESEAEQAGAQGPFLSRGGRNHRHSLPPPPDNEVSFEEYFSFLKDFQATKKQEEDILSTGSRSECSHEYKYIHLGRPMRKKESTKTFNANAYMCDDFPLDVNVVIQLLNVISTSDKRIEKLKTFLSSRLPRGFPLRLDIPVFPTVSAIVTFQEFSRAPLDSSLFELPRGYTQDSHIRTLGGMQMSKGT